MDQATSRRTALITGASAGIGAAFARVFAEHGFDLVLTARRQERLQVAARELSSRFNVDVRTVVADLADPASPSRIFAESTSGGRAIDVLVNNAGYGMTGALLESSWDAHERFIRVMMTSLVELTYLSLPGMIDRRYGRILNVASLAGLVPSAAGHTLYGASKSFVIKFSQSVGLEVQRYNVYVTALCPGFTHTEFHDVNNMRELVERLPKWMWMDVEPVVREGYDALMRGDLVRVTGYRNKMLALVTRLIPERLVLKSMKKYAKNSGARARE